MRTVLILLSVAISVAVAVERKSNFTKPVINLDKRPRSPVWNRPPEERRKLSIFPKTNMKFVITPKPVQDDNMVKKGLTTKRPIMRKFVMQDNNEKATWSFAPREPLMKTKRYTVTLAPPKFNKEIDELKPDESRKVRTVISNLKKEQQPRKVYNLNKGNLIETMPHKKVNSTASKTFEKLKHKHVGEENSGFSRLLVNDTKSFDLIEMNQNKTMSIPNKNSEDYVIDVRSLKNAENVVLKENETKTNAYKYIQLIKMPVTLSKKEDLNDAESRNVDLSELTYPIDQNVNNSLTIDNDNSDKHKAGHELAFNDIEILLEKIVNQTEEYNAKMAYDHNGNNTTSIINSLINDTLEDTSQFDVTKPNAFYDVISLDKDKYENKIVKETSSIAGPAQDSLITGNVEIAAVSDSDDLHEVKGLTDNSVRSLVVGNLENLINFMEQEKDKLAMDQGKTFDADKKEIVDEIRKTNTKAADADETTSIFTVDKTKDELTTEQRGQLDNNNLNSEEILLEVYESNRDLSSEEISAESLNDKNSSEVSKESVTDSSNMPLEEISNEARDTSDESISDTLNNHTEELSNEPLIDVSKDLTTESISNESSSNVAAEELSNEFDVDNSNNLTEEVSNQSIIETSDITDEESSNVSSLNMSSEVLSNESNADKSINLTEAASNEFIIESSNLTSEEIFNESSSNMAGEELSNESYLDKSNNLTDEVSNESVVGTSNNVTGDDTSDEWLVNRSDSFVEELIADESVLSAQDPSVEEISDEALTNRFKRNNNIIEEENLATTVSGFKYTNNVKILNHDLSYKNINA